MTAELTSLLGCTFVLFISLLIQGFHTDATQGFRYALSNRNRKPNPDSDATLRIANNVNNQIEGLALFIPLILVLEITQSHSSLTEIGAWVYLASRTVFVLCYIFGIKNIRSLAWFIGIIALGLMAFSICMGT